ncbi:hypothetical protein R3P38DRAFT_3580908, partial [Favolaschia claudopus]
FNPISREKLKRDSLVACVQRQQSLWPKAKLGTFNKHTTNMPTMIRALLGEPFTTTDPLPGAAAAAANTPQPSTVSHHSLHGAPVSVSLLVSSIASGPAKLGTPDLDHEGYQKILAIIPSTEHSSQVISYDKDLLCISNDDVLQIFVLAEIRSSLSLFSSSSASETAERERVPLTESEFNYLHGLAKNSPGYEEFDGKHNQRLVNVLRVNHWRFAATFFNEHHKKPWPANIKRSGGRLITKGAIGDVLKLGSTALTEAIKMTRLISVYYDEQSPHRAQEVVDLVENRGTTAKTVGAEVLK